MIPAAIISTVAILQTTPAMANWSYCYQDTVPEGVNAHPDYPPRPLGFERYVLPQTFKRLCGHPSETETAHVRALISDALQCTPVSDLAQRIEDLLTAPRSDILQAYFDRTDPPVGPEWDAVCSRAEQASVATLAYGGGWYFDSDTPDKDWGRIVALSDALTALSASLEGTNDG